MKKQFDIKKLVLLNLPYLLMGLFATNFGEAWRLAQGANASEKFLSLFAVLPGALQSFWPSLHPLDLLVGLCCGAGLRLAVYLKSKNAKKYRHGMEYGSARWGTREDKKDRSVQYSYRCGGYASKVNSCSAHSISADNVEALILSAVKRLSRFVLNDEEAFAKELQALWNEKQTEKPKHNKSELHRFQKRYDELSKLIRGLYENLVSGLLPERQYKQLMKQYDDEQAELETKIEEMEKELTEEKVNAVDIKHFISLIRKCKEPTEISDLMFAELIDKIVVYEAEGVGKARTQKVDIYFNYVGQVDIAYTEEELAEIKAQEEQIEMERLAKQREREKAYREKRKAKKLAENGGEIVKTKICPHCQKEFVPTSNRQIFCSKDCCYQARQDKTKADREAEKGNHYYRQRVCAVCGSTYWPAHSQQKFCSEECQKQNHNEKSLEFYHKKRKEKSECKDLLQTKELVSSTNSSEIITIPA